MSTPLNQSNEHFKQFLVDVSVLLPFTPTACPPPPSHCPIASLPVLASSIIVSAPESSRSPGIAFCTRTRVQADLSGQVGRWCRHMSCTEIAHPAHGSLASVYASAGVPCAVVAEEAEAVRRGRQVAAAGMVSLVSPPPGMNLKNNNSFMVDWLVFLKFRKFMPLGSHKPPFSGSYPPLSASY